MRYRGESESLGRFGALFTPSPAPVAQIQHLRLTVTVGDEGGHAPPVDIGDAQLTARRGVLHTHDDSGAGREAIEVDPVLTGLARLQQSGDICDVLGVGIGDPSVDAGS